MSHTFLRSAITIPVPEAGDSKVIGRIMKTRLLVLLWCCSVAAPGESDGQDSTTHQSVFPAGIAAQFCAEYVAIRDGHISDEKYAGPSSGFALNWSRFHESYGFRIGMTYEKGSHIRNHNVSAEVSQGAFTLVDLYPVGRGELFGDDLFAYLGPSAEAFVYYRTQNIAQNTDATPNLYQSGAWLFSLGARLETILLCGAGFQTEGALQVSLLSLGGGTGNVSNTASSMTLLTPLAGVRGRAELGVRYYLFSAVSIVAGYRLDVTRIDSWNYILESSDNAFVSLSCGF